MLCWISRRGSGNDADTGFCDDYGGRGNGNETADIPVASDGNIIKDEAPGKKAEFAMLIARSTEMRATRRLKSLDD